MTPHAPLTTPTYHTLPSQPPPTQAYSAAGTITPITETTPSAFAPRYSLNTPFASPLKQPPPCALRPPAKKTTSIHITRAGYRTTTTDPPPDGPTNGHPLCETRTHKPHPGSHPQRPSLYHHTTPTTPVPVPASLSSAALPRTLDRPRTVARTQPHHDHNRFAQTKPRSIATRQSDHPPTAAYRRKHTQHSPPAQRPPHSPLTGIIEPTPLPPLKPAPNTTLRGEPLHTTGRAPTNVISVFDDTQPRPRTGD